MAWFKASYEPGGAHYVKITDSDFSKAQKAWEESESLQDQARDLAREAGVMKYDARDFPVPKILGTYFQAYQLRQEQMRIPEDLWMGVAEPGRKEQVEYQAYLDKLIEKDEYSQQRRAANWQGKSLGGKLFSVAARAAAAGVANAATGKSGDLRGYEKHFASYLAGDSPALKEYLLGFAREFGGNDDGVLELSELLRQSCWRNEFLRFIRK